MEKFKQSFSKIMVIILYILVFFGFSKFFSEILFNTIEDLDLISLIGNLVPYTILLITAIVLLRDDIKTDFTKLNHTDAMSVFRLVCTGIVIGYAGNYLGSMISMLLGGGMSENQNSVNSLLTSNYGLVFMIITVFMGPIVEELVFRKAIHGTLRNFKLPTWAILTISSILFGLLHVINGGDFINIFPYIGMGFALGYIEVKSENIYPSIFAHMFINGVAVLMTLMLAKLAPILPQM